MDVFDKCIKWDFVKQLRLNDAYPYFKPIQEKMGTQAVVDDRQMIMIGSNDYLGLSGDPRIVEASNEALQRYGASSCGSRFLNGTNSLHIELEEQLAHFMHREKAIVFSTGYQTNLGVISSILGRNDVAVIDRQVHASIIDALRLASCKIVRFKHNDMEDLEKKLRTIPSSTGKLIIVDGVFSMEGDIANLRDIIMLKQQYGARLLVDDAHGVGVLGKYGRGTGEHFNVEPDIDLITGTFSKAFGSLGGFVVGDMDIVDYIQHQGRSMIFSASMTPASVAANLKALEIIRLEPERRTRLDENTRHFISELRTLGFNTGNSETPIVPIHIGDTMRTFVFWKRLMHSGIYTNPIISPAVQQGDELIRTSLMATHTKEQLDTALGLFEQIGLDLGIISKQQKLVIR